MQFPWNILHNSDYIPFAAYRNHFVGFGKILKWVGNFFLAQINRGIEADIVNFTFMPLIERWTFISIEKVRSWCVGKNSNLTWLYTEIHIFFFHIIFVSGFVGGRISYDIFHHYEHFSCHEISRFRLYFRCYPLFSFPKRTHFFGRKLNSSQMWWIGCVTCIAYVFDTFC